jgi:hydrogenase nickel incorporation protein HypA/HybF
MHELSIAMSIVDMVQEEAQRHNVEVEAVYLDLGMLAGITKEALLFSYQMACEGTEYQGSRLVIKEIPIEVYCPSCDKQRTLSSMQWFRCPDCGALTPDVIHGKELTITALEVRR